MLYFYFAAISWRVENINSISSKFILYTHWHKQLHRSIDLTKLQQNPWGSGGNFSEIWSIFTWNDPNSHVKGILSKIYFNVLTTKHCASFSNFFVSSMVIMSCLLRLLNKPRTPKTQFYFVYGQQISFFIQVDFS